MLSALILIPLIGSVLVGIIPDKQGKSSRVIAICLAIAVIAVNFYIGLSKDYIVE